MTNVTNNGVAPLSLAIKINRLFDAYRARNESNQRFLDTFLRD